MRTPVALGVAGLVLSGVAAPAGAVGPSQDGSVVSATAASTTPHVMDGSVNAIVQVGDTVVAAGTFTRVSPATTFQDTSDDLVRRGVFAFDATTGAIDPTFDPELGGTANSLTTDGSNVYVGGSFTSVGGNTRYRRVVKLSAAGAVDRGFRSTPDRTVNEVVYRAGRLYVGGYFTSVKDRLTTSRRAALAALDPDTGAVLRGVDVPFTGVYDPSLSDPSTTTVKRFDLSADGSKLVAIGNFKRVGGQPRSQVAVLDVRRGTAAHVSDWSTTRFDAAHNHCARRFASFVRDVDFSPDGSWFAVTATGAYSGGARTRTLCDTSSRWETSSGSGAQPTWIDYTGGDTSWGVAVTSSAVYVGGHMRWQNNPFGANRPGPGAVARPGIAALDPANGLPLSWNPGRSRGVGAQAVHSTPDGLWVGSDTTHLAGALHGRIGFFPLVGGTTVPTVAPPVLPNDLFLATLPAASGVLLRRPVDARGRPTAPVRAADDSIAWSTLRGGFLVNGTLYYGSRGGGLFARSFDAGTATVGTEREVDLHDDPDTGQRIGFDTRELTGTFFDPATHRLYYTLRGKSRLFYRYFTPESEVVGAQTFRGDAHGVDFSTVAGMTLAGGRILYGSSVDGSLRSVPFRGARVTGAPTVLSADRSWNQRAMFVGDG